MCGRYAQSLGAIQIQQELKDDHIPIRINQGDKEIHKSYNVAPTNFAPVIYQKQSEDEDVLQFMSWGLIPLWQKTKAEANQYKTFNARKESILEGSKLWLPVRKHKRCVVPIQGYYEWKHKKLPNTKKMDKIPYYIRKKDEKLLFLAGLYEATTFKDTKEQFYTFTIITGPAPNQLEWLHERMPIVLEPGSPDWKTWLSGEEWNKHIGDSLKVHDSDDLEWYEVTRDVGKTSNEGEYLIKPVKQKGISSFFQKRPTSKIKEEEGSHKQEKSSVLTKATPKKPKRELEISDQESNEEKHKIKKEKRS